MNDTERRADGAPRHLEHLSALIDGELDGDAADGCCAHWREQAEARRHWHAWHLIGDVLRSEELACGATRNAQFLERVRSRLDAEPVVLAPAADAPADSAARQRRPAWRMPAAVAAGFVAVAVALIATRGPAPSQAGSLAQAAKAPATEVAAAAPPAPAASGVPNVPAGPSGEPQFVVADEQLVRDSRLDRYLAAHKQFGGSSVLGVPSGFLRSATLQTPER